MMNRMQTKDNSTGAANKKRDSTNNYGYESGYTTYHSSSSSPVVSVNQQQQQPLPGQPPLPPMPPPPPSGPLTPMSHLYPSAMPLSQLSQVAWPSTWHHHWIAAQATGLPSQPQRDLVAAAAAAAAANNIQANNRATYNRRTRYNTPHNNNPIYSPNHRNNNNFNRNKNRRQSTSPQQQQQQQQQQQHQNAWFNQLSQHGNYVNQNNDALISLTPTLAIDKKDSFDQDIKIVSEISVKKTKQRKPMSVNYPSRPWKLKDAEAALAVEQDHNQRVRAQSLIIKFPDPDLNKQVVGKFHEGIKNIHFQSPSGPRYCFIQMAENVNIDEAIKELEQIQFGSGHLKVERKSMKKEEEDLRAEIIDPYTLYVGNLPESVNVNELKSKFPTATRVDVGYAQKMRNTRYAFVRYSTVEDSIAVYKSSQDLMWDTRSTIVRFRRDKKNKIPPGEVSRSPKKVKVDPDNAAVKKEEEEEVTACNQPIDKSCDGQKPDDPLANKTTVDNLQILTPTQVNPIANDFEGIEMITTIKEEPLEALDDESYSSMNDDDSDDENDIPNEMDDIINNDDDDDDDGVDNGDGDDDDDDNDDDDLLDSLIQSRRDDDGKKTDSTDNLDPIFNQLGNISDIEL